MKYLEAIRLALSELLAEDKRVFIYGQDIAGPFGGAFKATKGLSERFPDRVLNSPISEDAMTGMAIGAAMDGMRPIVEYQFADFASVAFNQLVNHAGSTYYRTGLPCPLVARLPVGGTPGGGPFHCQMPEAWLSNHPGLVVVAPATVADAYFMLKDAVTCRDPVAFLEHKYLYYHLESEFDPKSAEHHGLGRAVVRRPGEDLTIVAWSGMVHHALAAATELDGSHGISAEVVDLRCVRPLDTETILASLSRTGRIIIASEGWPFGGPGAEVAALVAERGFPYLDAPPVRLAAQDTPIPFHPDLFTAHHPDDQAIVQAALDLAKF
jgi:acetoin:2,6-dichlorophenolindophenol oxidoreductase subunit beta